jgi:hypothetical protein
LARKIETTKAAEAQLRFAASVVLIPLFRQRRPHTTIATQSEVKQTKATNVRMAESDPKQSRGLPVTHLDRQMISDYNAPMATFTAGPQLGDRDRS